MKRGLMVMPGEKTSQPIMGDDERSQFARPPGSGGDKSFLLLLSLWKQIYVPAGHCKDRGKSVEQSHGNFAVNQPKEPFSVANNFELGIEEEFVSIQEGSPEKSGAC